ncbi:MAG TPA: hypothetical protein VJ252_05825 [Chthoniobacterales bacterium]|nr:hypothetical protein [Chthoniobacterales bacterium]
MKKFALTFLVLLSLGLAAQAGSEAYSGKDMKQVAPPPCPEWYADNEWNVNLWGAYLFTGNDWEDDEYLEADHAWGGGLDAKYFFHRYFGIGVEAFGAEARRETFDIANHPIINEHGHDTREIGAFLGTFTLRYPFHCSRFAPYIWGGGGAIFGGGERDEVVSDGFGGNIAPIPLFHTEHRGTEVEGIGQIGAGFEVRFTRHVGWTNDFSWNFVTRDNSDFGMVRSGINFAF